jgi:hypothetical protein
LGVPGNAIENLPPDLWLDLQPGPKGPWMRDLASGGLPLPDPESRTGEQLIGANYQAVSGVSS